MAYTKEQVESTFNAICDRITEGESLRAILRDSSMPSSKTFFKWIDSDKKKVKLYARACEDRADSIFEEIIQISDDGTNDYMTKLVGDGLETEVLNSEHIQRSRLRVEARKWMLSKMQPKKYGDRIDVTSDGQVMQAPIIVVKQTDE